MPLVIFMSNKLIFIINYLICFIIYEKKDLSKKIQYLNFFLGKINFIDFILFTFNRNKINPLKSFKFRKFIEANNKKWINKKKSKFDQKTIIVENFINHPSYTVTNAITALFLNQYFNYNVTAIMRYGDLKGEIIFRSYGIKKFLYLKNPNFKKRLFYLYKAFKISKNIKTIKQFCKINYNGINIGLSTYDTFIRYTGVSSLNNLNNELIVSLADSMAMCDQIEYLLNTNKKIKISVQSETAFNPLNSFFQICLKKKIEIFARCGEDYISLRRYTNWKQRHDYRYNISQKIFNEIYACNKKKILKLFEKIYIKNLNSKNFGIDARIKEFGNTKIKEISKNTLIDKFKWSKKKIVVFFLNHYIDRNFHNGPRVNFQDNYTWTDYILKLIPKINNVNWIIKPHPTEFFYNSKKNHKNIIKNLVTKHKNIKLFPNYLKSSSLLKIADVALTSHGTAGIEYPAFKINSIFVDNSSYSNLNLIKMTRSKKEIVKKLMNINKMKKLTSKQVNKCRAFLVIQKELINSKCSLIPNHVISRNINEENFWAESLKNLKKFKYKNDIFFQMLKIQLQYKLRHTINLKNLKIRKRQYNDY